MLRIETRGEAGRLENLLQREWLETNGRGGYASSTVLNCHTRRYHGLLVANLSLPAGRHVLLSRLEDSLHLGEEEYFFSCHCYPDYFFPPERSHFAGFRLKHWPVFFFRGGGFSLEKAILMPRGYDGVLIRYDVTACRCPGLLRLKPFLAFRSYHAFTHENPYLRPEAVPIDNGFAITPYEGMPTLFVRLNMKCSFTASPCWYRNFEFTVERDRGFDWHEDLFLPGVLEVPVHKGSCVILAASLGGPEEQPKRRWKEEAARRGAVAKHDEAAVGTATALAPVPALLHAADQFLVTTPSGRPTIIAGYHWFGDWGRDTLIALPGLTFCRGRIREGIDILVSLGQHERDGLLPNFFSEDGQGRAYNAVDAPLWFFWAVQQLLEYALEAIDVVRRELWPVLQRIVAKFIAGTLFDIHTNDCGLLHAGNGGPALTWMDACVQGIPVTPRWGYPVEINALWYNALCFARCLAQRFGEDASHYAMLSARLRIAYRDTFWIADEEYLGDVFHNGFLDSSVRPNQILAVSLPFSPLDPPQWRGVVRKVTEELLTPCGLRTLSPSDLCYRGTYSGDAEARDRAYHQGTVWPWLLAHYGEAYLRAADAKQAAREFLLNHVGAFLEWHLPEAGVGSISEIFDGDPPHRPNGCIAQAWSVAGLLQLCRLLTASASPD